MLQLRSFLGRLIYYGKFISNLATLIHPLNQLLREDVKWNGNGILIVHRREAKKIVTSSIVTVHKESNLSITMSRDGDSHILPDSSEPKNCICI